jgi:hypothetical protein
MTALKDASTRAEKAGQDLLAACAGDIFPCDALALSVLTRTLSLIRGFQTLVDSNCYTCAAPLVRLQLDSALRLHGVITCRDPHIVAHQVCSGVALRTIKHSNGGKMTDKFLQQLLEKSSPWLPEIYSLSSAYVHLSDQHFLHLMMQSTKDESGTRTFAVSDEEEYIPEEHRASLVKAFSAITRSVLDLVEHWTTYRTNVTNPSRLKEMFGVV